MKQLPDNLKVLVDNFTPLQKAYCEWRARGLTQAAAAAKAGSRCDSRASLARSGWQFEQAPGAMDYIDWLRSQRSEISVVDQITVIQMLKDVYEASMKDDDYKAANKSVEILSSVLGLTGPAARKGAIADLNKTAESATTGAFKEELDEDDSQNQTSERIQRLQSMLKDLNKK